MSESCENAHQNFLEAKAIGSPNPPPKKIEFAIMWDKEKQIFSFEKLNRLSK